MDNKDNSVPDKTPGNQTSTKIELSQEMSLFSITMIGVGAMIGAGIFVLTGLAAGAAGPALILSFFLNGVVTDYAARLLQGDNTVTSSQVKAFDGHPVNPRDRDWSPAAASRSINHRVFSRLRPKCEAI